ncbi:secretion-regulating guanine nucleotide exchange factor isoform X4 [Microtus ochrogaster]|uniref:Secretion-regulating guanine nucleotide exchange factor isoform X4 n=1 Tax=Microtus ochrogaster TaxID=79684 RepID=A0ABM1USG1_MICOH|nr:secretion-regulating guanine nucleotide exchange factor isoform X4 [Microtus ochrogaster]
MARVSRVSEAGSAAAALFGWGANSYGQLGLGHKEDVLLPQQLSSFCEPGCIRSVTGGGGHSAAVTDRGRLFVCGLNKDGQLGLGHTEDVLCFTICKPLLGCPIKQVACGWDFTIMLTELGQVLSCGSNAFGQLGVPHGPRRCMVPQTIELLREKVVCVAAGLRHALATTVSGSVFQWGTGLASSGQRLCPGQTLPLFLTAKEPSRVTDLENSTCVVAGSDHSAALTDTGELYVWGRNKHGQLASLAAFLLLPQRIDARCFQNEKLTAVWSGWTHLVAQTDFLWLRTQFGNNCLPGENCWTMSMSAAWPLTGRKNTASLGPGLAATCNGDKCCAWGWNEHGMCGDGTESNVWTPSPVQALQSAKLLLVGCGAGHSLALCQLPAHLVPCQDLKVTYPLHTATENTESQDVVDKEKLEG